MNSPSPPPGPSGRSPRIFTFLTPADAERLGGIPPQAIVGWITPAASGESDVVLEPDTFRPNPLFRQFLQEVLSRAVFQVPALRKQAQRVGDGWVYVIDGRVPDPGGDVPAHDIVGGVEVRAGSLVPDGYRANPAHQIVSDRGLFRLPPELQSRLVEAMKTLPPVSS